MKILLTAMAALLVHTAFSQRVIDVTNGNSSLDQNSMFIVGGTPFVNTKYVRLVDGTPYFNADWMKGSVVSSTGTEFKNLQLKLDMIDNEIHYQDKEGTELVAVTSLKEVILTNAEGANFRFIHSATIPVTTVSKNQGWYLWLASGPATLYKRYDKMVRESRPYNSATTEQTIITTGHYVVHYNNALLEIKKIKDAPSVLANKKTELEGFLKNKDDQNASMDDRFTALVTYYNSLLQEKK